MPIPTRCVRASERCQIKAMYTKRQENEARESIRMHQHLSKDHMKTGCSKIESYLYYNSLMPHILPICSSRNNLMPHYHNCPSNGLTTLVGVSTAPDAVYEGENNTRRNFLGDQRHGDFLQNKKSIMATFFRIRNPSCKSSAENVVS